MGNSLNWKGDKLPILTLRASNIANARYFLFEMVCHGLGSPCSIVLQGGPLPVVSRGLYLHL